MYDDRTRHARHVIEEVEVRYGITVLQPPVRKSIRFAEAPARGQSILQHAPKSRGAEAYRELARLLAGTPVATAAVTATGTGTDG
jgi:chromosome partitioning protein